jgi:hypothetical protein
MNKLDCFKSLILAALAAAGRAVGFTNCILDEGRFSCRDAACFEGRTVTRGQNSNRLAVAGQPARVILRWRFDGPTGVTVNRGNWTWYE